MSQWTCNIERDKNILELFFEKHLDKKDIVKLTGINEQVVYRVINNYAKKNKKRVGQSQKTD